MVKRRWLQGVSLVSLIAALIGATAGRGQPGKAGTAAAHLSGLRAGQWIQLEGTATGPSSVSCTELGQLAGDFLDDDWSLKGAVRAIDAAKREFAIGGCRVRVNENTTYDNPRGTFRGFSDLRAGMLVEVDGAFLHGRMLLAAEVDDESDEMVRQPKVRDQVEVLGKIERVDARRSMVTVMGIEFHVTAKTRLRTVIE